jgi:SagB-type dehydrogenase family enzyme
MLVLSLSCSPAKPATIQTSNAHPEQESAIELPEPRHDSAISIEQSLLQRRSIRSYTEEAVTLQEVSQLLWAAQGITDPRGFRTAPSAGALYPLEVYIVAGNVENVTTAVYKYVPDKHALVRVTDGDKRAELADAALSQRFLKEAAVVLVITAVYDRTTVKYGDRGIRYVHIEVGHAAQNVCLQATALGLGVVPVGAFHDEQVGSLLNLPKEEVPLYIIPVGRTTKMDG